MTRIKLLTVMPISGSKVGDGRSNGGDGINGSGDDSGDNGDGDGGVGAKAYSAISASVDAAIGGCGLTVFRALRRPVRDSEIIVCGDLGGSGVTADSSVSKGSVSSAEGAESGSRTLPSNTITNPKLERETEVTKDTVLPTNNRSTKDVQPPVVQVQPQVPNSELAVAPVSAPMPNLKSSIPYPSRRNDERRHEKANDQVEKFYKIFQDMSFEISLAVILNKLPEKLGDPDKFLIPCDFPGMEKCLALADLGASINLMPLSVWKKLSLPELTPTCMTLELADRSITKPIELTLRVGKEAMTFNLDQTSRYSSNYDEITANRIDIIEMACEEYSQEVLGFSDVITSGNPTPYYDPVVSTSSPTLTPIGDSDFLLEEVDAFLAIEDDPTSPEVDDSYCDPEGDILFLESFLNDDPSPPPPTQGNYLPEIRKELKICKAKTDKSLIDEPPEVKLKDL
ncbi:reverse transcriptase domain-containing protein, partial [Tanacetum coccineum]